MPYFTTKKNKSVKIESSIEYTSKYTQLRIHVTAVTIVF